MSYFLSDFNDLLQYVSRTYNKTIYDAFLKTYSKLETKDSVVCAISGGADSDILLDLICKVMVARKISFSKIHFIYYKS